jgi:(p)ppGpp synthase/HD superfamily hydrolase
MHLADAVDLATEAHREQVDKAGLPYIDHPLRVMRRVSDGGEDAQMAAVLHDVLEDTPIAAADLLEAGCPVEVVAAVEMLSRRRDETYPDFVRRIAMSGDPIAIVVKLADITDNADENRLRLLSVDEASRLRDKYREALAILMKSGRLTEDRYARVWETLISEAMDEQA